MSLTSMATDSDGTEPMPTAKYGYGLRIYLNDDQCEALGIKEPLRAGTKVTLQAIALVVTASESVEDDGDDTGPDISLSLQITDLDLKPQGVASNAATLLYGDNS